MKLLSEGAVFLRWLNAVISTFSRTDPWHTWAVIIASTGQKVASLLAFFLPLKVILLLGSDGVPRYFRGFITSETRDDWILVLASAAVGFYIISILLERIEKSNAIVGSGIVLREATQLAVVKDQDNVAQGYYVRFCRAGAAVVLSLVLMMVVLLVFPDLFYFLVCILILEFLLTSLVLEHATDDRRGFAGFILGNTNNYLTVLSSVNFLLVFGFLLAEFIFFQGINILIAILSVLITRQLFLNISLVMNEAVRLSGDKAKINTLVFSDHQLHPQDTERSKRFRSLFNYDERVNRTSNLLGVDTESVVSRFTDKGPPDITILELSVREPGGESNSYYELIFPPSKLHLVENENMLFKHVSPHRLWAAELVAQYEVDGFYGRIYQGEEGRSVKRSGWKRHRRCLVVHSWGVSPSDQLIRIFCAAKPLLHQRLTEDLIGRLEVAIDCKTERDLYDAILTALPSITSAISQVPLFIYNPQIGPSTLIKGHNNPLGLNWGHWTLAPVGAGLGGGQDLKWFRNNYSKLVAEGSISVELDYQNIELCLLMWELETRVQAGQLKSGVELLSEVVSVFEPGRSIELDRIQRLI